jgi:hypothetical protein
MAVVDNHPLLSNLEPTTLPIKQTSFLASSTHSMTWQSYGINGAAKVVCNPKLAPVVKLPKHKQSSKTNIVPTIFDYVGQNDAETKKPKNINTDVPSDSRSGTTPSALTIYPNEKADHPESDSPFFINLKSEVVQQLVDIAFLSGSPTCHTHSTFTLHAKDSDDPSEDGSIRATLKSTGQNHFSDGSGSAKARTGKFNDSVHF